MAVQEARADDNSSDVEAKMKWWQVALYWTFAVEGIAVIASIVFAIIGYSQESAELKR